jgi:hypothetical protein
MGGKNDERRKKRLPIPISAGGKKRMLAVQALAVYYGALAVIVRLWLGPCR